MLMRRVRFNHLLADEALSNWRFHLEQARERQLIALREASYQYPDIERVRQTLSNEAPASATDLAALLVDRLEEACQTDPHGQHRRLAPVLERACPWSSGKSQD